MSGHSKWANIKRKKGANDFKKGQEFSKLSRAITVAAKLGGGDPNANASLRLAVEKAKQSSMPKDNIDKAIKKGTGALEGQSYEQITYEGFGANGVGVIVDTITDNRNRTVAELRLIFSRHGGSLGNTGSASYMFADKKPVYTIEILEEETAEKLINLFDDLNDNDDVQSFIHNSDIEYELE